MHSADRRLYCWAWSQINYTYIRLFVEWHQTWTFIQFTGSMLTLTLQVTLKTANLGFPTRTFTLAKALRPAHHFLLLSLFVLQVRPEITRRFDRVLRLQVSNLWVKEPPRVVRTKDDIDTDDLISCTPEIENESLGLSTAWHWRTFSTQFSYYCYISCRSTSEFRDRQFYSFNSRFQQYSSGFRNSITS